MKEIDRIQDQIRRAFEGEAWHGASVLEVLDGVTPARAARRPIASAHSIWEIALHIAAWKRIVARRVGGETFEVTTEMDWPPAGKTDAASWRKVLAVLHDAQKQLLDAAGKVTDARIHKPLRKGSSSPYIQLLGVAEHDIYHAGQIAVLKKGAA